MSDIRIKTNSSSVKNTPEINYYKKRLHRISLKIKDGLREQKISKTELTLRADITTNTLASILDCKSNPKFETLCRIEKALKIRIFSPF